MKRYTHYRLGLLIGLLSLHILSACVHTRQELGTNEKKCLPNWSDRARYIAEALYTTSILGGAIYGVINHLTHPAAAHNITASSSTISTMRSFIPTNRTTSATPHRSIILSSIAPTEAGFILNATEVDPSTLAINGKPFELTTDAEPADGIAIKNPMILEEHILNDIIDSGFSTKRIQHWLNKGLDIDAKEPKTGLTLSMHPIWLRKPIAFRFIMSNGADVNISNKYGYTLTMLAAGQGLEDTIDYLIKIKGADVCKKDVYGQTARDLTANISNPDIQTRIHNEFTEAMKKQNCTSYTNQD
ncbi:MAG: hypothetical protein NMK33_02340 [Candidatus Cardinium sp.]|uniref:ankyrin repeat domain-containing protein n=1 Tax=Cardinium endosymbiont of Dermatophagoides farinae TaxID=2597823 RepID=UPI001183B27B|nr:hypothetical protein [Cardinium endosymbiont of Dermatophagoides farinae]TSJ81317.1 hypothetical protein FPG78_05000 [Cardinium endosymbiont of Dermatophagoides farinae]UWW97381.1 MAG: hypothetical protein NMK33_02340 [Candidatus Cardinium sp.]